MQNVDEVSVEIETATTGLTQFITAVRDQVAPLFEQSPEFQADLVASSEAALAYVQDVNMLSCALAASLRFSLRNVSTVARDAVMFHQQQISMRVQHRFNLDPELAELAIGWMTGEIELPEGVSDSNAVSALLWLITDVQEALEGLVYEDCELEDAS